MRILILAHERLRDELLQRLIDRYLRRLPWRVEVQEPSGQSGRRRRTAPGAAGPAPRRAHRFVIALDERGRMLDSVAFARLLDDLRGGGFRELVFVVGGPEGLPPEATRQADLLLSLGPMTLPHALARLVLVEQLYRAHTLLSGHPYHRVGAKP